MSAQGLVEACLSEPSAAGGRNDGDDAAQILKASWRETRRSVMRGSGVAEFSFRQYLFACQARVLLKLGRPAEVCTQPLCKIWRLVCIDAISRPSGLSVHCVWYIAQARCRPHSGAAHACRLLTGGSSLSRPLQSC